MGRDDCDELDAMLKDWDGTFSPLIRKRVARHVEGCDICGERRKKILSPWMLLAGVPMFAAPAALRDRVVNDTELVAYSGPPISQSAGGGRWNRGRTAAAAAAVLLVAGGAAVLWPNGDGTKPSDQPIGATSTAAPTTGQPTLGTTGPSADPSASTTASTSPEPSASVTGAPALLTISSSTIDLGTTRSVGSVVIRNTGDQPADVLASSDDAWLLPALGAGTLGADESTKLTVTADRDALGEGPSTGTVLIRSADQTLRVTVTITAEHPPFVGRPTAPDPSCRIPTVTASVQVIDESRLARVTLSWTGPDGSTGQAIMTRSGSVWVAKMGPFNTGGPVTFRVRATDSRGNTALSPVGTANATPCPQ
jgi:hypothetical protein